MKVVRVLMTLSALTFVAQMFACSTPLKTNQGQHEERQDKEADKEKAKQEGLMEEQERQLEEPGER